MFTAFNIWSLSLSLSLSHTHTHTYTHKHTHTRTHILSLIHSLSFIQILSLFLLPSSLLSLYFILSLSLSSHFRSLWVSPLSHSLFLSLSRYFTFCSFSLLIISPFLSYTPSLSVSVRLLFFLLSFGLFQALSLSLCFFFLTPSIPSICPYFLLTSLFENVMRLIVQISLSQTYF